MQPNDLVANNRPAAGIGALQQFTSDKRQLYAAVEKVKWNPTGRGGVGAFAPMENDQLDWGSCDRRRAREPIRKRGSRSISRDLFAVGTLALLTTS